MMPWFYLAQCGGVWLQIDAIHTQYYSIKRGPTYYPAVRNMQCSKLRLCKIDFAHTHTAQYVCVFFSKRGAMVPLCETAYMPVLQSINKRANGVALCEIGDECIGP